MGLHTNALFLSLQDNESFASEARLDAYQVWDPIVSLDDYLTPPEPIRGTDVVAWVMHGLQHLPRSEDVPLIHNIGPSGFQIKPWNIYDSLPSITIPEEIPFKTCRPAEGSSYSYTWAISGNSQGYGAPAPETHA